MIWAYRALFLPVLLFVFPHYLLRMIRRGGYARDFSHRFGNFPALPAKRPGVRRLWVQAVSVGEINAVAPLLRALSAQGGTEVVLTTTTSTGYAIAREKLAPHVLATGVFPIDFMPFSARAWRRIQPDLIVLMEGELWPEHLHQARRRGVPVALINARLSDRSFRRYSFFKKASRALLDHLACIGVASHGDAQRFAALGVPAEKITLTGNLKFDVPGDETAAHTSRAALRAELGFGDAPDAPVLLGSSTWPGEEVMLLDVLRHARERGIPLRLLLVPRHAERRAELAALLAATQWRWFLRSQNQKPSAAADVCVADTTGELNTLTTLATLAFVGKSLPPHDGGQTPIECAARGVPMVYGPRMTNFLDACKGLESENAAVRVGDSSAATENLLALLEDPERRAALAANARRWHNANQGATRRTIALLDGTAP